MNLMELESLAARVPDGSKLAMPPDNSLPSVALAKALIRRGVWAWNGRGRIRFSFHGYNGSADVDRIMEALRAAWPG